MGLLESTSKLKYEELAHAGDAAGLVDICVRTFPALKPGDGGMTNIANEAVHIDVGMITFRELDQRIVYDTGTLTGYSSINSTLIFRHTERDPDGFGFRLVGGEIIIRPNQMIKWTISHT